MKALGRWLADLRAALGIVAAIWVAVLVLDVFVAITYLLEGRLHDAGELTLTMGLIAWMLAAQVEKYRCPLGHRQMGPHQAIVSASVEPSADIREAARNMTEIRTALIASGYTPEQASRQIAHIIAANQRGAS